MRLRLRQQFFVQQTLVERRVAAFGAVHRFTRMRRGGFQQRRQIQLVLLGRDAVQLGQELGAADQIHQLAHAQLRHDLAGFTRDKLEVIRHAFRQAVVVIAAQLVVLSRDAGRAVVEVADAQVFTTQRHHRPGAEAEAFRTGIAALTMSTPVFRPPSTCRRILWRRPLATSACWVSTVPSSQDSRRISPRTAGWRRCRRRNRRW